MDSCIDKVEMTLLEILRREVTGQDGTEKMELSVAGLNAVMRLAREHAVTGLVANAAMRNRIVIAGGVAEGRGETVMRLMQQTMAHKQNQRRFEDAVGRFARLMKENSIAYVVFKGLAVARYYPEPFVRTMGDVDFYVPQRDFLRAVEVIERDQHRFDRMIDEAMAEHTDSFTVCDSDGNETEVSVLPPTEDLIVVFKHWFNHLLVEGVGLRQTLDLAVLLNAYRDKINVGRLMTALDGIGYMKAFRAMLAMMKRYFGFEWLDSNFVLGCRDERYADKLMAVVMESGNFGRKAYRNHTTGKKKSMETATRALRHCVTFLRLAPKDILCLIPRRIGITLKQKF